jgi:hypothetical protein
VAGVVTAGARWIGRGAIGLFMLLAAAIAPQIGGFEGLFHYLQTALSYLVPPVAAVFLLGVFSRRAGPSAPSPPCSAAMRCPRCCSCSGSAAVDAALHAGGGHPVRRGGADLPGHQPPREFVVRVGGERIEVAFDDGEGIGFLSGIAGHRRAPGRASGPARF